MQPSYLLVSIVSISSAVMVKSKNLLLGKFCLIMHKIVMGITFCRLYSYVRPTMVDMSP